MQGWTRVCALADLLPGESRVAWDGDTPILVVNLDGALYAVEDRCTHEDFELSAGSVDAVEGSVECVLHGARFDLRSGHALCGPAYVPVTSFPVQVVDGDVWTRDDR
ncbi:Rieske (2Fe-2S) protein [Cognatilysobacter lacus]|uniref:Non-heme iron oxygenase ferredoxin subunit n=1 Tax=Cognatilysobacter lacus TaxID=1643323 RepID=A0A5D8Z9R2_9GAMM|nr:non-heme iron oxygenase ferredoxin subunit [Lysobacter lacus]TZF91579.1 non-heme iron oxygenase ferredoxin subunit [Lysobacter lacus]